MAHWIEGIAIDSMTKQGGKKMKPLDHYLKPLGRTRRKSRPRTNNNALVVAHLERIAARKGSENGG